MPRSASSLHIDVSPSVEPSSLMRLCRRMAIAFALLIDCGGGGAGSTFGRGLRKSFAMCLPPYWVQDRLLVTPGRSEGSHVRVTNVIGRCSAEVCTRGMLKPVELEIELFCRGMRIDPSCHTGEDGRRIARTRAGLGSGLEIVIPNRPKAIWVNVPVVEPFAQTSPLVLHKQGGHAAAVRAAAW